MKFDISTAAPVLEREGALKNTGFDINTAAPIGADSSNLTAYDRFVKEQFDADIKKGIVYNRLDEKELNKIKANTDSGSSAFWAFTIPYVKGAAGFFTRPFGVEPFGDTFPKEEVEKLKEEKPFAYAIGEIIGGVAPFIATAPLFPQGLLGIGATFASVAGVKEVGRQQVEESLMTPVGEKALSITKEVGKAAAFAPVWHYAQGLNWIGRPFASALIRAGVKGAGSATLTKVFGADLDEALRQGGIITALSLIFEAPGLAKTALGRGIVSRAEAIAKEQGLGDVKIPVDRVDAASTRTSLLNLIKGFYRIMKHGIDKTEKPSAEVMAIQKYIAPPNVQIVPQPPIAPAPQPAPLTKPVEGKVEGIKIPKSIQNYLYDEYSGGDEYGNKVLEAIKNGVLKPEDFDFIGRDIIDTDLSGLIPDRISDETGGDNPSLLAKTKRQQKALTEFRKAIIAEAKSLSTPTGEGKVEQVIKEADLPPDEPPQFPGVKEEFLKQPKKKTKFLQYFIPAEYHLKELGFDAEIGKPVRRALQDFSIELMEKNKSLIDLQKEHYKQIPKDTDSIKASNEKIWVYMDKGIPKGDTSVEAETARKMRAGTEEMLKRINELNKRIGKEEVKGLRNYILHMLKPEILNEIYAKGVIPPELAKVMEYIPPKNLFLRTAQQRKGVPEEWLVKNPYELMKAMYAIDLRYIYLQDALAKIDPYLKAVKSYKGEEGDYWPVETYEYLDNWIKQDIKMRPSNWDRLIDNQTEALIAPLLRKQGVRVSHMPWRDLVNFGNAAAHTGALGMRIGPILRNLVQSSFDWVMYGTKPYLKGSAKFMTEEGHKILSESRIWKTRMPIEAQDLASLKKMFKVGTLGYRASDLHNVGKGLLTRYYHAIDDLKMGHKEALEWADDDLPGTQWSYRREDLPRAYWTTTGRAFWTLGSWWMNFYNRFLPELLRRAFTGKDVLGRTVPVSERLGIIRFLALVGLLYAIKEGSRELTGTAVDYMGQIKPTPLREAPIANLLKEFVALGQSLTDGNEANRKRALRNISNNVKIFIPWYLAGKDLFDLLAGEKEPQDIIFYTEKPKPKKKGRGW